ncbi:LysE family translocator [Albimonas sp. CAU 1670]|uniref:LysE family translocator n=1 Tax=Albimonas sp. CAU 1670 TaxID=3032599 RepID=UPI0023DBE6EA|nr:LysE family translocator [Albimonas sp. CAU 1670]MDF2232091.1 LysE family translocator [Albimonas sp. CAU 1670]
MTLAGIEPATLAAFVAVSALGIVVPGPNVALILAVSARDGLRAGLAAVAGTTVAHAGQIALVAFGLAWIAQAWGAAFEVLRWIGVAWLVWIGVGMWREARRPGVQDPRRAAAVAARRGLLVGLANPKSLAFHAAFLPQFVDAAAPAGPQLALLGATYLLVAGALDSGWACLGAAGRRGAGPAARAWMARGSGAALIGGAAWLAFARRS